jgi:oligosaccharide repeat unit polymerase
MNLRDKLVLAFFLAVPLSLSAFGANLIFDQLISFQTIMVSHILALGVAIIVLLTNFSRKKRYFLSNFKISFITFVFYIIGFLLLFTYLIDAIEISTNLLEIMQSNRERIVGQEQRSLSMYLSSIFIPLGCAVLIAQSYVKSPKVFMTYIMFVCIGALEGSKAGVIIPTIYLIVLEILNGSTKRLLLIFPAALFLSGLVNFGQYSNVSNVIYYITNGHINASLALDNFYDSYSYHVERILSTLNASEVTNVMYKDFVYHTDSVYSNTAVGWATYYYYFGYAGIFIYFVVFGALFNILAKKVHSVYAYAFIVILASCQILIFFEEYFINGLFLFIKIIPLLFFINKKQVKAAIAGGRI